MRGHGDSQQRLAVARVRERLFALQECDTMSECEWAPTVNGPSLILPHGFGARVLLHVALHRNARQLLLRQTVHVGSREAC